MRYSNQHGMNKNESISKYYMIQKEFSPVAFRTRSEAHIILV
jgi:hypothetical protein